MIWILLLLLLVAVVLWLFLRPIPIDTLVSKGQPAADYAAALQRVQKLSQAETQANNLHDVCHTKLMSHGHPTDHVIVFLHGYTTCPEQFTELGRRFFDLGYNVFIPCLRYHGYQDRLTDDLRQLTAEDMVVYADDAVDIARGLGRQVTVFGISGGGTIAAWLAQNRADVDYAIPLSATLGLGVVPAFLTRLVINLFLALPNRYVWWDPRTKANNPYSIYYAYPRFSSRSLGQVLRLGWAVQEQAKHGRPATRHVLMITNAGDHSVSNAEIERLMALWAKNGSANLSAYQFEKELKMLHDIITPGTPGIPIEEVYARLIDQVQALHQPQATKLQES